jgi:Zn-dependent protease
MRGSIKLFTWLGIPVLVHWSFLAVLFIYVLWGSYSMSSPIEILWYLGLVLAILVSVVLHEYGHAIAARRYNVRTRDILLIFLFGMARLERVPEKPKHEFVIAIAGPLTNILLFGLTILGIGLLAQPEHIEALQLFLLRLGDYEAPVNTAFTVPKFLLFCINFALFNLMLAILNLLPVFPLDGGRVLRALLSMRIGRAKATRIASWVGQGFAVLFAVWGIYSGNIMLAVLGLFVIYAARSENDTVQTESMLGHFKARDLVRPQFSRFQTNDWMINTFEALQHGLERHFLVFDLYDNLVGLLEEPDILNAQRKSDPTAAVSKYMQKPALVSLEESMLHVHHLIRQRGYGLVAVTDAEGQLVGVIDEAGLNYFLKNRA